MKLIKKYSLIIGLLLMLIILLLPLPEGLTIEGKGALAVFAFALFAWLFRPYAEAASSLLVLALLILLNIQSKNVVFGALGSDTNFLVLSGLIISIAMAKTGLAKRIALFVITRFGKSSAGVLLSLMFVNVAIAFLMPSGTARTTLLLPIALAVIGAFGIKEMQENNIAKQVTLTIPAADHFATSSILTATGSNILVIELLKKSTDMKVYYSDWLLWSIVPNIILIFVWWVMVRKLFPSEETSIDKNRFVEDLKNLGALTLNEVKTLSIFLVTVLLWITDRWTGLDAALVAVIGASLLFIPKIGVLDWKDDTKKLNWGLIVFNAAAIASGAALGKTKAVEWIMSGIFSKLNVSNINPYIALPILLFVVLILITLTSSKTGRITMLVPIMIGLAQTLNINPAFFVMPVAFFNAYHFIFPFNAKSNLIYYGTGHIKTSDMAKSGVIISLLAIVVLVIVSLTYWRIVGLTP